MLFASSRGTHADPVDAAPDTLFALGLERWLDNDAIGAGHWLDRLLAHAADALQCDVLGLQVACARLIRARMGSRADGGCRRARPQDGPGTHAGEHPSLVAAPPARRARHGPGLARRAHGGGGEPGQRGLAQSRPRTRPAVGREPLPPGPRAVHAGTGERLHRDRQRGTGADARRLCPSHYLRARALLAKNLAKLCDVPWPARRPGLGLADASIPLHVGDPVGRFWSCFARPDSP